MVISISG